MDAAIFFDYEVGVRLLISFFIGTAIGFEREYHSKAAGLRTMIMICLGSTIFTEISMTIGDQSPDRIASNIITGIGFLGAGVIFKDGLSISGITTATAIWICAALGMAVGAGEYFISFAGSIIVLIVLAALQPVTRRIERFHQSRTYSISYDQSETFIDEAATRMKELNLKFIKRKDFKHDLVYVVHFDVAGKEKRMDEFNSYLKANQHVRKYNY